VPPKPPEAADPEGVLYKKMRSADVQVDSAIQDLNDALNQAEKLAPRAGGDAEKALLSVVEQLDQAGETLADYENAPDTIEEFRKNFNAQDERRLHSINTVLDAVAKTTEASTISGDLAANVPEGFKKDLAAISDLIDEAQSELEQSVVAMGGKVPDDGVTESTDPAQDTDHKQTSSKKKSQRVSKTDSP
jgi:uncharacterized protein YukE